MFENGMSVRVSGGYDYVRPFAFDGAVGKVIGEDRGTGGYVWVRFPVGTNVDAGTNFRPQMSAVFGPYAARFHESWLHPVVYARSRYFGPGMTPGRSEFLGSRIVVSGARGNRNQLTMPYDDALFNADANHTAAVERFARERLGMVAPDIREASSRRGVIMWEITETGQCECSDEYGPCEAHGETVVIREGASLRSADELCHEFLGDVASVLRSWPSDEYREAETRLGNALADSDGSWFDDPDDADECRDLVTNGEAALGDAGYMVIWDDGYRIVRPYAWCPLLTGK
jgi:hypothetical protein